MRNIIRGCSASQAFKFAILVGLKRKFNPAFFFNNRSNVLLRHVALMWWLVVPRKTVQLGGLSSSVVEYVIELLLFMPIPVHHTRPSPPINNYIYTCRPLSAIDIHIPSPLLIHRIRRSNNSALRPRRCAAQTHNRRRVGRVECAAGGVCEDGVVVAGRYVVGC